jgi:hypothetical protein
VYVFTRGTKGWRQVAVLAGSGTVANDYFGGSVAASGTTIVVGAPGYASGAGRVYVFTKGTTGWQQVAALKGSGTLADDVFGVSVATSGTTIVAGAPGYASGAGRVYVFTKGTAGWEQTAVLTGPGTSVAAQFGGSVDIWGRTVVVGAFGDASQTGRAYVFTRATTGWHQVSVLVGSGSAGGDAFGLSIAVVGTTVVVGTPDYAVGPRRYVGRVYLFTRTAEGWHQTAVLTGPGTALAEYFGASVAASATTMVVGARGSASQTGLAYVFTKATTGWHQVAALKGSGTAAGDAFGAWVGVSGATAVIGAPYEASKAGRVYVFKV